MRISVLASSSRGNASLIAAGNTVIMVDAGISARRISQGLSACEVSLAQVSGVCITHEHADHVMGLGVLTRGAEPAVTLYCSRYLRQDLYDRAPRATHAYVEPGQRVQVGEISVIPFAVSHDALDPLGYIFEHDGVRLGYVTDTGHVTRAMEAILQGVDALYVESNYDEDMLQRSGRPRELIKRIEGRWGHLSNSQAGELVRSIAHPGLRHVILAHISPECNTPALAEQAMRRTLNALQLPTLLHTARQTELLPWIEL